MRIRSKLFITPVAATIREPSLSRTASTSAILDVVRVGRGAGAVVAGFILRVDQVRSDALDLIEDVIPAGKRNGDHQDHAGVADHQAERGQERAEFVGAKRFDARAERFDMAKGTHFRGETTMRSH